MSSMRPEEAEHFYEEDEDPARVHALFDAAEREKRLRLTGPPERRPDLVPLRELLAGLMSELRQLRLWERLFRALASAPHAKAGPRRK
jgi:hypothetical protein